jgi:hypothetical protein
MELRKFIATTIREYLNEYKINNHELSGYWYHGTNKHFNSIKENHCRFTNIFKEYVLKENYEKKKTLVLNAIKNNDWEKESASNFKKALNKSKHKEMLTDYSVTEFNDMKLFKLNGFDIGYALKKKNGDYSEIVAVFNNEDDVKGIGEQLIQSAVDNGGCYLDHFDGYLSNLYQTMGFDEYDRYKFDPQYDVDGSFRKKYGEADVIFRKHKKCR